MFYLELLLLRVENEFDSEKKPLLIEHSYEV